MKKIIIVLALLLSARAVHADDCTESLGNAFTPNQSIAICGKYGDALTNDLIPATAGGVSLGSSGLYFAGVHGSFYTTASSDLAATGSVQGDAALITTALTYVTGADATKGVKLPATGQTNAKYIIVNTAAAVLKIWPNTSDTINATGADSSVSVAASTVTECWRRSATAWWCNEGVAP